MTRFRLNCSTTSSMQMTMTIVTVSSGRLMTMTTTPANPIPHLSLPSRPPYSTSEDAHFHLIRPPPHCVPNAASPIHQRSRCSSRSGDERPSSRISLVSATATLWMTSWSRSRLAWRRTREAVPSTRPKPTYVPPSFLYSLWSGMVTDSSGAPVRLGFAPGSVEPQNQDLTILILLCVYLSTFRCIISTYLPDLSITRYRNANLVGGFF
jgi:hypothetical protein